MEEGKERKVEEGGKGMEEMQKEEDGRVGEKEGGKGREERKVEDGGRVE